MFPSRWRVVGLYRFCIFAGMHSLFRHKSHDRWCPIPCSSAGYPPLAVLRSPAPPPHIAEGTLAFALYSAPYVEVERFPLTSGVHKHRRNQGRATASLRGVSGLASRCATEPRNEKRVEHLEQCELMRGERSELGPVQRATPWRKSGEVGCAYLSDSRVWCACVCVWLCGSECGLV